MREDSGSSPLIAGVPDVRERLHHDLTVVAGIGKRFLVAGHAGRENDLPAGRADRAVWLAHIHLSVFENENGILRVKHHELPESYWFTKTPL